MSVLLTLLFNWMPSSSIEDVIKNCFVPSVIYRGFDSTVCHEQVSVRITCMCGWFIFKLAFKVSWGPGLWQQNLHPRMHQSWLCHCLKHAIIYKHILSQRYKTVCDIFWQGSGQLAAMPLSGDNISHHALWRTNYNYLHADTQHLHCYIAVDDI